MQFNEIRTRNELADFLGIERKVMTYVLFVAKVDSFYVSFDIPKKDGTSRSIFAPQRELKTIQSKLAQKLWNYQLFLFGKGRKRSNISHAFEKGKSIISNANIHKNKRIIVCFDLKDFFDSFHFGRVAGFFEKNRDYKLPREVSVTIAQLTCYKGHLPQGAPSSPIITNLICDILDAHLLKIARKYRLDYTRYADDLTFSTNSKIFLEQQEDFVDAIRKEIESSGFQLNDSKTRIIYKDSRQQVTGLVVNRKINVPVEFYKNTRAMAMSLYEKGEFTINGQKGTLKQLEGRFAFIDQIEHYNNKHDLSGKKHSKFTLSAKEKAYRNFLFYEYFVANNKMLLLTEGKTDILYIKAALKKLYKDYPKLITKDSDGKFRYRLSFFKRTKKWEYFFGMSKDGADAMKSIYSYFDPSSNQNLCKYFKKLHTTFSEHPIVFLFDNEKETKRPLKAFISCAKLTQQQRDLLAKNNHLCLEDSVELNLVSVPLPKGKDECELEDLFSKETLELKIDGRSFSRKDEDKRTCYNKDVFSKYIFKHYSEIDFSGFRPLLDILNEIIK